MSSRLHDPSEPADASDDADDELACVAPEPSRDARLGLWVVFVVLAVVRFPRLFHAPTFYAEEGNVYFGYAANHGVVDSLFELHVGYFSLWANGSGIVSAAVPLQFAVLATRVLGLVGPVVCAWVIIESRGRWPLRAVSLAIVAFTFTMSFEWATTIHAQFWFAVAVLLMLAVRPSTRRSEIGQYVLALVAGLTGVLSCIVAPVYVARWLRHRPDPSSRRDAVIGSILSASLLVHLAVRSSRDVTWNIGEYVVVASLKLVVFPLVGDAGGTVGPDWYGEWTRWPVAAASVLLLALWATAVVWFARDSWRSVALVSLGVGLVALWFALPPYDALAFPRLGGRYALVGVVPVLVAIVMSWDGRDHVHLLGARIAAVCVVGLALLQGFDSGVDTTVVHALRQPVWEESVEAFADDRGETLEMDGRCAISVNSAAQRDGFDVEAASPGADGDVSFDVTPGRYDRDVPIEVFVFSNETFETLTPGGWKPIDGFLYGGSERRCRESVEPVEPYGRAAGTSSIVVTIPSADLDSIAERSRSVSIGYGRDFADALAKDTFDSMALCRVRLTPCEP